MLSSGLVELDPTEGSSGGCGALPLVETADERRMRVLKRYGAAHPQTQPLVSDRETKIRNYQDLLSGEAGSKYVHADYRPNGGTQLAGMSTHTRSMTADFDNPSFFKSSSTTLAKGAPAIRGAKPPHLAFRVA